MTLQEILQALQTKKSLKVHWTVKRDQLPLFCDGLANSHSLVKLTLCDGIDDKEIIPVMKALEQHPRLTRLAFVDYSFGDVGVKALAKFFKYNTSVYSLALVARDSLSPIHDTGVAVLANILLHNSALRSLKLLGCDFGIDGASYLASALKRNRGLTRLDLGGNQSLCVRGNDDELPDLGQTGVRAVNMADIYSDRFGRGGLMAIAHAVKINRTLQSLSLVNVGISDDEVVGIMPLLLYSRFLAKLDLADNLIDAVGVAKIVDAILKGKNLIHLNLSENAGIDDRSAQELAVLVQCSDTLRSLTLNDTGLGDIGVGLIARALENNTTLTRLNLEYINISDRGAYALANALICNTALTHLDLKDNADISLQGTAALEQAVSRNRSLVHLNLDLSYIEPEDNSEQSETEEEAEQSEEKSLEQPEEEGVEPFAETTAKQLKQISLSLRFNAEHSRRMAQSRKRDAEDRSEAEGEPSHKRHEGGRSCGM